jgi:hypothetical protein
LLLSTNWHRRTQDDEQKTLSRKEQVVEEEETKCSSCLCGQCQIEQDIPQDSAQDGKEHLDQDTDNRENSGEVIQESHYNEPENLQKASEEIVEETSLSLSTQVMHSGNQLEMPKEIVLEPEVMTETTTSCKTPTIETEPGSSVPNCTNSLTRLTFIPA